MGYVLLSRKTHTNVFSCAYACCCSVFNSLYKPSPTIIDKYKYEDHNSKEQWELKMMTPEEY